MKTSQNSFRRRGNGEGTIYKRGKKWGAQVMLNKKRKSATFKTHKEAVDWIRQQNSEATKFMFQHSEATFGDVIDKWLISKKLSVRNKTYLQYETTTRLHLKPRFRDKPFKGITSSDLSNALININADILSIKNDKMGETTRTTYSAYQILKMVYNYAVRDKIIQINPMTNIERPNYKARSPMHILTEEEAIRLIDAGEKFHFDTICALTVTTGLREGEVLGLSWQNINLNENDPFITITRQAQYIPGKGIRILEPKTDSSHRKIPIGRLVLDKLLAHKKYVEKMKAFAGERWKEHNLVFPSTVGTPISVQNFLRKYRQVLKAANLPKIGFHDLRHTAASLMLLSGIHIKVVSERLGHSDIRITLDLYSHIMPSMQRGAADTMDLLVAKTKIYEGVKKLHPRKTENQKVKLPPPKVVACL